MATPQTGIFALGTISHAYLELDLAAGAHAADLVALTASLGEPRTMIGGVNVVAGFRPELWADVAPDAAPPGLTGFGAALVGPDGCVFPATQHDAVVWLAGAAYDVVFDESRRIVSALAPVASLGHEIVGWPYHRDRDLTGFIDGTENPTGIEASGVAVVPAGAPGEGGSVLLLQQWEHDARAWDSLPVPEQEQVMGRRKLDSAELDPKLVSSHVARTDQEQFGQILRRNIGYGTLSRHGTIFVGFSADQRRLAAMLDSMLGREGGVRDDLTRFARAVTGAYYFVPSSERLAHVESQAE